MPYYSVSSKNQENIHLVVAQLKRNAMERYNKEQNSNQYQEYDRQGPRLSQPSRPQTGPSFSNKALLAMTATGAGAIIAIGYALFQYQAEIALLVGVHVPPALLVGLAILAAAIGYLAYRACSMFGKRPERTGHQQQQNQLSATVTGTDISVSQDRVFLKDPIFRTI